jgi:phage shock protein A
MGVMERVSRLLTSDLGHLLEQAEEPEAAIEELIGDLEESIVDLRREMVTAVARQNRVRTKLFEAERVAGRVESEASLALACGKELRARHILSREIGALKARDELESELAAAGRVSARLVAALIRMEDRAQLARRKQDELTRTVTPRRKAHETMAVVRSRREGPAGGGAFDAYSRAVGALECEAARPADDEGGGRC